MFAITNTGHKYVDRGDVNAYDFEPAAFITDYTWRELDLSDIVDKGAVFVFMSFLMKSTSANSLITFRKNGQTYDINQTRVSMQSGDYGIYGQLAVALDADGKIQYKISNVTWTFLHVVINGWIV